MRIPYRRRPSPAPNATNGRKEKSIACSEYHKAKNDKALPAANAKTARKEVFPLTQRGVQCEKRSPPHRGKQKENDIKIVLFPIWGAMWGSNPRHPEPQSGALPTELISPCRIAKVQKFLFLANTRAINFFIRKGIVLVIADDDMVQQHQIAGKAGF